MIHWDTDRHFGMHHWPRGVIPRRPELVYGGDAAKYWNLVPVEEGADEIVRMSELRDVIEHCHAEKIFPMYWAKHAWRPDGFRYNQDGIGYCHTEDTEVLTSNGWTMWPEYDGKTALGTVNQTTQMLEFQYPTANQVFEYDGEMIYSTNRRLDFGVTPNHRMYVRKWNERKRTLNSHYDFVLAKDIGWYAGMMHAPSGFLGTELVEVEVPGDRRYDGDDFIAMLSLICSDGFAGGPDSRKTKNLVSFCCFTPKDYDKTAALAARVGFKEQPSRRGVWNRWDAGALSEWIRGSCYSGYPSAQTKRIPDIVKWTSERQIKLFLEWYHDQAHKQPLTNFYSSSRRMVGDLQELLLRIGKRSTEAWRPSRTTMYQETGQVIKGSESCQLLVSKTERLCIDKKKHIEQDRYKGLVYCATVPNGTLVTRRNGTVLISSNCWTWSGTGAIMSLRAVEDHDHVDLAPVSMGWLVDWQDRGNYLEDFIRGARDKGIAPASMCGGINSHDRNPGNYDPQWETERAKFRLDRVWDTDNRAGAETRLLQLATVLRAGRSGYCAWNHLGHAMETVGINWTPGEYLDVTLVISNSHNEDDFITMKGSRAIPDETFGLMSTVLV